MGKILYNYIVYYESTRERAKAKFELSIVVYHESPRKRAKAKFDWSLSCMHAALGENERRRSLSLA